MSDDIATQNSILPEWMKRPRASDAPIEVPLDDAPVANLFFALDTQWRRHAMTGKRIGIDYTSVAPTAQLFGIAMTPELMADIRMMEDAALAAFAR